MFIVVVVGVVVIIVSVVVVGDVVVIDNSGVVVYVEKEKVEIGISTFCRIGCLVATRGGSN